MQMLMALGAAVFIGPVAWGIEQLREQQDKWSNKNN